MNKMLVLTPGKEYIVLRKAAKSHVCHECKRGIPKGASYIEDHLNYASSQRPRGLMKYVKKNASGGYLAYYVNRICLLCWRGELP